MRETHSPLLPALHSKSLEDIQQDLFSLFKQTCTGIVHIDLKQRTAVVLHSNDRTWTVGNVYDWDQMLRVYSNTFLDERDIRTAMRSFSAEHLLALLHAGQHSLSLNVRYNMKELRWVNVRAYLLQREKDTLPSAYIILTEANEECLLNTIVNCYVYNNCDYFIYLNTADNSYTMFSGSSDGAPMLPAHCDDYAAAVVKYASTHVVPEDQEMVIREMSIARVREQLDKNGLHAFYCGVIDPVRGYTRKRLEYRYYDQPSGMVLLSRTDVTTIYIEQQAHEKELESALRQAKTDPLTGLLNYQGALEHSMDLLRQCSRGAAFFFIDLDNFKVINNTLGHARGDEFLRQTAAVLRAEMRPGDMVGRVGGDEFVALLPGLTATATVEKRASRLCDALARLADRHVPGLPVSCSIGIALAPKDGEDYKSLAYTADMRLYAAKAKGKNGYCL